MKTCNHLTRDKYGQSCAEEGQDKEGGDDKELFYRM